MGTQNRGFTAVPVPPATIAIISRNDDIRQNADIVTVRVNYRWGGPVIAKY
jgi:outer membrane immunogenic protein